MKRFGLTLASAALSALMLLPAVAQASELLDAKGMVVYAQMGGKPGDPTNSAREAGARSAAALLGIKLVEQNGGWDPQVMLQQAKDALAAQPDGIIIIGNQGPEAFVNFLKDAKDQGIAVVVEGGNLNGTGLSYFGGDNYGTGKVLGEQLIAQGKLKAGDKAVIYGDFANPALADIAGGTVDAFTKAGVTQDHLQWSAEAVKDPSLAVPVLVGYLEAHPDTKAIAVPGHGGITAVLQKVLEGAGKQPGEVVAGGYDISPASLEGLRKGYLTVVIDQQFYLQGYMAVMQVVLEKKYDLKNIVVNTATGVITKDNVEDVAALVERGVR